MALGDSVTAAMFAKGALPHPRRLTDISAKNPLQLLEYRGVSYATGRDPGALTLANFMNNYTPNVGGSTGAHLVTLCAAGGPLCTPHWGLTDGLNSAISGAHASNLPFEASCKSLPLCALRQTQVEELNVSLDRAQVQEPRQGRRLGVPQHHDRSQRHVPVLRRRRLWYR